MNWSDDDLKKMAKANPARTARRRPKRSRPVEVFNSMIAGMMIALITALAVSAGVWLLVTIWRSILVA